MDREEYLLKPKTRSKPLLIKRGGGTKDELSIAEMTELETASASIVLADKDSGMIVNRLSTTDRDSIVEPREGMVIWNTDQKTLETYDGDHWKPVAAGGNDAYRYILRMTSFSRQNYNGRPTFRRFDTIELNDIPRANPGLDRVTLPAGVYFMSYSAFSRWLGITREEAVDMDTGEVVFEIGNIYGGNYLSSSLIFKLVRDTTIGFRVASSTRWRRWQGLGISYNLHGSMFKNAVVQFMKIS